MRLETEADAGAAEARAVADDAAAVLGRRRRRASAGRGCCAARLAWHAGRVGERRRRVAARPPSRAARRRERFEVIGWRALAAVLGPTPVDEAIERCEAFRASVVRAARSRPPRR